MSRQPTGERLERIAAGRAARHTTHRGEHAQLGDSDRDALTIIDDQNQDRLADLVPLRWARMVESPFAFYRGACAVMSHDLATTPATGVTMQICGDAHLANFGLYASPERDLVFDLNDFDETLPGPWEWDVKRLAASFTIITRDLGVRADGSRRLAVVATAAYREGTNRYATMGTLDLWYAHLPVAQMLERDHWPRTFLATIRSAAHKARARDERATATHLTEVVEGRRRIRLVPPLITAIPAMESDPARPGAIYRSYLDSLLPSRRLLLDQFTVRDAARKVVGVGSVGTRCYIALLDDDIGEPLVLQAKEATTSALARYAGLPADPHPGRRVVVGQRLLQTANDVFLGWADDPVDGRHYYWRQLRDMKGALAANTLDVPGLRAYASLCGETLARAHARAGDVGFVSGYLGTTDRFDEAIGDFALAYADRNEADFEQLRLAVRDGRIAVDS